MTQTLLLEQQFSHESGTELSHLLFLATDTETEYSCER